MVIDDRTDGAKRPSKPTFNVHLPVCQRVKAHPLGPRRLRVCTANGAPHPTHGDRSKQKQKKELSPPRNTLVREIKKKFFFPISLFIIPIQYIRSDARTHLLSVPRRENQNGKLQIFIFKFINIKREHRWRSSCLPRGRATRQADR